MQGYVSIVCTTALIRLARKQHQCRAWIMGNEHKVINNVVLRVKSTIECMILNSKRVYEIVYVEVYQMVYKEVK